MIKKKPKKAWRGVWGEKEMRKGSGWSGKDKEKEEGRGETR